MIVGFTITDYKGHEDDAVAFIRKKCILESPTIAENIVKAGTGINIFSNSISESDLASQPFKSVPIVLKEKKLILVSIVNFNLELTYNEKTLRLVPTEYIYIDPSEIMQFIDYIKQGLVRVIPEITEEGQVWILEDGEWNDSGVWIDSAFWRD